MDNKEITERFFKHRRNMLLLSGGFIFLVLSGGTIDSVNILGSHLKFSNPNVPVKLLFWSLIYMLIKYFQFLCELNGPGIKTKIYSLVSEKVPSIAKDIENSNAGRDLGFSVGDYDVVGSKNYFTFEVVRRTSNHVDGETTNKIAEKISDRHEIGFKQLWKVYAGATLRVIVKTTWVAEYFMPLALSGFGMYLYLFIDVNEVAWIKL